jgi:hypothetical protein
MRKLARLLDDPEDMPSDINRTFEPLLLVTDDDESTFLTVEEGKGNLLVRPYTAVLASRPAVFGEYIPVDIDCQPLFGSPGIGSFGKIRSVAVLSLVGDEFPPDYFCCCGLKLTSEEGLSFSVGTHLTEPRIAGLWLLTNAEVLPAIRECEL